MSTEAKCHIFCEMVIIILQIIFHDPSVGVKKHIWRNTDYPEAVARVFWVAQQQALTGDSDAAAHYQIHTSP